MTRRSRAALLLALAGLIAAAAFVHQPITTRMAERSAAANDGLVVDDAQVLTAAQRRQIAEFHEALRRTHDIDFRVQTTADGGDVDLRAHTAFARLNAGARSISGRGLLLLIDAALDSVRLEVSTSLEGVYTDAFVAYVQHRQMLPFFEAGRIAEGILATTELIVARAHEAHAGAAFAPPMESRSMGGGATASARLGAGYDRSQYEGAQSVPVAPDSLSPSEVVDAYHAAMANRDGRPDLPIYTAGTVAMMRNQVITPGQMDSVARTYARCTVDNVFVDGNLAVVRYAVAERQCSPYFLQFDEGAWRLDLTETSRLIRFNHNNQWRLSSESVHLYAFAFQDWRFDAQGFPH
jgi:uncharacterized protein